MELGMASAITQENEPQSFCLLFVLLKLGFHPQINSTKRTDMGYRISGKGERGGKADSGPPEHLLCAPEQRPCKCRLSYLILKITLHSFCWGTCRALQNKRVAGLSPSKDGGGSRCCAAAPPR